MKRLLPLLFLYLLATLGVTAQEKQGGQIFHTGSEGPIYDYTVEAGLPRPYYDDGGPDKGMRGNYSMTIVQFKPLNSNSHITIVFEQIEIGQYDELRFYNGAIPLWNGPNEDGEYYYDWPKDVDPIMTVKGTPANPRFTVTSTAADGCLSVALFNGSNSPGWKAMVYCVRNGDPEPGTAPQQAAIRYVSTTGSGDGSSWSNASSDLQAMIDASSAGDEIWVAKGTYHPTKLIKTSKKRSYAFILKEGVSLYGGFAGNETTRDDRTATEMIGNCYRTNETILSADDDVPDVWTRVEGAGSKVREEWQITGNEGNSNHVLYSATPFTERTTIDGFTLKGANADVWNVKACGGALYASGNVALLNCDITEHYAYTKIEPTGTTWPYLGGAVAILKGDGKALVKNCAFSKNMVSMPNGVASGAGLYIEQGTVEHSTFDGCIALDQGGAIRAIGSTVRACEITNSYGGSGGAIYAEDATLQANKIYNCTSMRGGAIFASASTIENNILYNCFADDPIYEDPTLANRGGGAVWTLGTSKLVGNLIYNCTGFKGGGVVMTADGIFAHNTIAQCVANNAAETTPDLLLPAGTKALNSISGVDAPSEHFVKPTTFAGYTKDAAKAEELAASDWHLLTTSSLIGTGTSSDYNNTIDIYGDTRMQELSVNPGAIAKAVAPVEEEAAIVMTVESTDKPITITAGGLKGTKFSIDWGDGNKVEYEDLKKITNTPLGNTIKIYGDDILALQANNIGLTALDVTNAPKLFKLFCNNNKLSELDLTKNTALAALYCSENLISKPLDISECTKMRAFDVSRNAIPGKLDLSKMSSLSSFKCFNNAITELLLPKTAPLNTIDCDSNRIATLDLTGINDLAELNCAYNELTELTLTGLPNLSKVYAPGNKLSKITFDPKMIITDLTLFSNKFATIDLSALPKLESLYLQNNELTAIDLTVTPLIKWLNLGNNKLSSLNVTPLTGLMNLRCGGNQIPAIDLSQSPMLNTLWIDDNKLTELDVQHQKNLFWLTCSGNELTKLDLSHNPSVVWLKCSRNKLTQLDLSALKALQMLYCDHNQISELKITNYAGLQGLFLQNNMMPAAALNSLIKALPNVSEVEVHDNNREWAKQLNISENPGTAEADIAPAQSNGWIVTNETAILAPATAEAASIYYDADLRAIVSETPLAQITLYSLQGEMIMHATDGGTHYALPELPVGSYLVHAESADGAILTLKVVVSK